jgi:parallel beta-helix repeat protein
MKKIIVISFVMILVLFTGCVQRPLQTSSAAPIESAALKPTGPPTEGDWIITSPSTFQDKIATINGNLLVKSGGSLTMKNSKLAINCTSNGQYGIKVEPGCSMIIDQSTISSANNFSFTFLVRESHFEMRASSLQGCGGGVNYEAYDLPSNGLDIEVTKDVVIENNIFSNNYYGIILNVVDSAIVRNNKFIGNAESGLMLSATGNIVVEGNTFTSADGQTFTSSSGLFGIKGQKATNNTISNNTFSGNFGEAGIWLFGESEHNIINKNNFEIEASWADIALGGNCSQIANNNIISENILTGGGNGIAIYNSSNNRVENNTISRVVLGIALGGSDSNDIVGNKISTIASGPSIAEQNAIELYNSSNNIIANNTATSSLTGILLFNESSGNLIEGNSANKCQIGIGAFNSSNNNRIISNNVSENADNSITIRNSMNNIISGNNLIGNNGLPFDDGGNQWDLEGKGNYWSDYTGQDLNSDGIGETAKPIPSNAQDEHPLFTQIQIDKFSVPKRADIPIPFRYPEQQNIQLTITTEVVWKDKTIDFSSEKATDIIIDNGGVLTLKNTTLILPWYFDRILVKTGGKINILDSKIIPGKSGGGFEFTVAKDGTLVMKNSELRGVGFAPLSSDWGALKLLGVKITIENCTISDTLRAINTDFTAEELKGSSLSIKNNTFSNCYKPISGITYAEGYIEKNTASNYFWGEGLPR